VRSGDIDETFMSLAATTHTSTPLDLFLEDVRELILATLRETTLRDVVGEARSLTSLGGKLLRSRLVWRVGSHTGVDRNLLLHGAAAVEMIHTASILHDDVIDGGLLRRGMPTFWVEKGSAGAILLGDLLLFKAIDLICRVAEGRYTHELVKLTGEVCEAESEQELMLQGAESRLEVCHSIARRKTGALFAFAAQIAGDGVPLRREALKEAGYLLGTAYQLADDLLDTRGGDADAGKTLGTDAERDIVSAARLDDVDLQAYLQQLTHQAVQVLNGDRVAVKGLREYISGDLEPALRKLVGA
jgi:heptaprenyl diphosphate synthase